MKVFITLIFVFVISTVYAVAREEDPYYYCSHTMQPKAYSARYNSISSAINWQKELSTWRKKNCSNLTEPNFYISKITVRCKYLEADLSNAWGEKFLIDIPINTGVKIDGANCNSENITGSNTTPLSPKDKSGSRYPFTLIKKDTPNCGGRNDEGDFQSCSGANLGARIMTYGNDRGLMIHGMRKDGDQELDVPKQTQGCIRFFNADLAAMWGNISNNYTKLLILPE